MEINEASMYQHYASRYGEILEYEKSNRAKIMRREQEKVSGYMYHASTSPTIQS